MVLSFNGSFKMNKISLHYDESLKKASYKCYCNGSDMHFNLINEEKINQPGVVVTWASLWSR